MFLRKRDKENWTPAKALVYSVEWIEPSRNDFGHYNVVFSYHAGGEIYAGNFSDYGTATEDYLRRDDDIDIRYNPNRPQQNYYPLARSATNRRLIFISIGLVFGVVALLCLFLNSRN